METHAVETHAVETHAVRDAAALPAAATALRCPICLEPCVAPVSLCTAQHVFCAHCLQRWLELNTERSVDCPVCRRLLRPHPSRAAAAPTLLSAALQREAALAAAAAAGAGAAAALEPTAGLALAMEAGSAELALAFVQRGARVGGVPPRLHRSLTPLMWAAEAGSLALCEALLDRGACPNERATPDSRFPLLIAAVGGRRAVLELLLQRGAEVDATMGDYQCARRSALLAAAAAGQVEMVALLCTAGADVNKFALRDGATALALAAARGSLPTVRILLASGALVNKACHDGTTPLHLAAAEGWLETCRALLAGGADASARRLPYGWSPLFEAAHRLDLDTTQALLGGSGVEINALDSLGRSVLAVVGELRWAGWPMARMLRRKGARHIAPRAQTVGFRSLFTS